MKPVKIDFQLARRYNPIQYAADALSVRELLLALSDGSWPFMNACPAHIKTIKKRDDITLTQSDLQSLDEGDNASMLPGWLGNVFKKFGYDSNPVFSEPVFFEFKIRDEELLVVPFFTDEIPQLQKNIFLRKFAPVMGFTDNTADIENYSSRDPEELGKLLKEQIERLGNLPFKHVRPSPPPCVADVQWVDTTLVRRGKTLPLVESFFDDPEKTLRGMKQHFAFTLKGIDDPVMISFDMLGSRKHRIEWGALHAHFIEAENAVGRTMIVPAVKTTFGGDRSPT